MRFRLPWRHAKRTAATQPGAPEPPGDRPETLHPGHSPAIDPDDLECALTSAGSIEESCVVVLPSGSSTASVYVVVVPAAALLVRYADDPAAVETTITDTVARL